MLRSEWFGSSGEPGQVSATSRQPRSSLYAGPMAHPTSLDQVRSLLAAASPAVLTVYREDGSALVSPVWFRLHGNQFEVVIATGDGKLSHLGRDPRCVLVVFETTAPFRRVEVRAEATLGFDGVADARLSIASRYLGEDLGRRFAEQRGGQGTLLRLPAVNARVSDLQAILPT